MNMRKILKGTIVLGIGAAIGYFKGVADCAYHVHKGDVPEKKLDEFVTAVDEAKDALHRATNSAEEAVEDVVEEATEAVEDTVEDVIEQVTEDQPED